MPEPPPPSKGWAFKGLTNGFRPPIGIKIPALVKRPHLTRSRRETWPWERAFVISWRSRRAFSASWIRLLSEYSFNQILSSRPLRPMLILLLTSFGSQLKQRNSFGEKLTGWEVDGWPQIAGFLFGIESNYFVLIDDGRTAKFLRHVWSQHSYSGFGMPLMNDLGCGSPLR